MSADIAALQIANTARWSKAKLTRGPEFAPVAKRLVAAKERYRAVEARTGVPWWVIAVIHERADRGDSRIGEHHQRDEAEPERDRSRNNGTGPLDIIVGGMIF